jgi:DNA-binding CsgD family transcriptional regulator
MAIPVGIDEFPQAPRAADFAGDDGVLRLEHADGRPRTASISGRGRERVALDDMLERARHGHGAVLVLRGETGIGKTTLLDYCATRAPGCRVARITGFQSELETPFAALHQLCAPLLAGLDALPPPYQQAINLAFGLADGREPDRFVVALAVLGLLAEAGAARPLVCLVDDAQWLDEPSRQVLGYVGRRLLAEAVLIVVAVRESGSHRLFPGLPSLTLQGLERDDARALLATTVFGHLDPRVRERILAETRGNPLRLLELPKQMDPGELAGGFGVPRSGASDRTMEDHYAVRIAALPEATRHLLLLASADSTGDATLLWRAAHAHGISRGAAVAAESEELLEVGREVRFRHSAVRSAAYITASSEDRRAAHMTLAEATDALVDPERRVWHRAAAATWPDEVVASQLEHSAAAAQARAGLAAAAAFLQRAVELTADPARVAELALAAAQAHLHAGALDAALGLLAEARAAAVDDVQRSRVERLSGQMQFASNPGAETLALVRAAERVESLDVRLARETYLDAWLLSYHAGSRAEPGGLLSDVSRAAQSAPLAANAAPRSDPLLDGLTRAVTDGCAAAAPSLRAAVEAFLGDDVPDAELLQWGSLACVAASLLWDCESRGILSGRYVEVSRASGALPRLSTELNTAGLFAVLCGDIEASTAMMAEYDALNEATDTGQYCACRLVRAAYQGRPEALTRMETSAADCAERGVGQGVQYAYWTKAIACNGLGRYAEALAAAKLAAYELDMPVVTAWALPELIEAAVRSGQQDVARQAMEDLARHMVDDADWGAGLEARSRALVTESDDAERWYTEAIRRLSATPLRTELARAHLLYGEWLRRGRRRVAAREQLYAAHEMFTAMEAEAFGERARRELVATGEKVRKRNAALCDELTPQEAYIARLARDGRTNADIAGEMFLSIRTVEWHLRKVFVKLGISSRRELSDARPVRRGEPVLQR